MKLSQDLWLTRCHGGRAMLTYLPPVIRRIHGTRVRDAFESPGEPLGVRHLCEAGVLRQFGMLPELLVPRRVRLTAEYLDESPEKTEARA